MTDVKLDHPGGQLSMPVREAVEGPGGIDVSSLLKETGFVTLDTGLAGRVRRQDPGAHTAAGGDAHLLLRIPARRASDGGALLGRHRAVDLLPGRARPDRPGAG